jgi:hypothetical protein
MKLMESKVLIVTSPNDWHWAISLEYLWNQIQSGVDVGILDLSYVGELNLRSLAKELIDKKSLRVKAIRFLRANNAPVYLYRKFRRSNVRSIDFAGSVLEKKQFLEKEDCPEILNSVVEQAGMLRPDRASKNIINREYRKYLEVTKALDRIDFSKVSEVVTVNGRFTKNATVKNWASSWNKTVSLIEFGSSKISFEHFEIGPHSMIETEQKIEKLWAKGGFARTPIAQSFLKRDIRDRDPVGVDWRAGMSLGKIPTSSYEKICTFFASTEAEFAGVGDSVPEGLFTNQKDAFAGLLQALDPEVWQVFLRRHPSPPDREGLDAESHLWDDFAEVVNVKIISPNSDVDSFALGMNSDLVANFCSTLAMDFIAAGKQEVITLGTAPWNSRIKSRFTPSITSIETFLRNPMDKISAEDTYPWAFFCATFGTEFKLLEYVEEKKYWDFSSDVVQNKHRLFRRLPLRSI